MMLVEGEIGESELILSTLFGEEHVRVQQIELYFMLLNYQHSLHMYYTIQFVDLH